ncbi:MAG: DUF362 domain-containing protein, partial [bacterium]|nr:DUF362 domain-containing protein [bacterium]
MGKIIITAPGAPLRRSIDHILDSLCPQPAGKKIWVKPNMLGPFEPAQGVTTSPKVLEAVVDALLNRQASVVVGDNPGVPGNQEGIAAITGILDASKGCWRNIGVNTSAVRLTGRWSDITINISSIWLQADLIINLPCLKTHALTLMTGAVKNMFGGVPGRTKSYLHTLAPSANSFAELLVEIYSIRPPEIVIMDALKVMEGNGPSGGKLRPLGVIIGGDNSVSVDAAGSMIMGRRPERIPLLREAYRRELGEIDLSKLAVEGEVPVLPHFKMPSNIIASIANRFNSLAAIYAVVPQIIKDKCIRCGLCARTCRSQAIIEKEPLYYIDYNRCISCYCCAEVCPRQAVRLPHIREELLQRIFHLFRKRSH